MSDNETRCPAPIRSELAVLISRFSRLGTCGSCVTVIPNEIAGLILARWPHIAGPCEVTTAEELDELLAGTKLLTPRTGHVWWVSERSHLAVAGSGGMYGSAADFLRTEGPATLLWSPEDATPARRIRPGGGVALRADLDLDTLREVAESGFLIPAPAVLAVCDEVDRLRADQQRLRVGLGHKADDLAAMRQRAEAAEAILAKVRAVRDALKMTTDEAPAPAIIKADTVIATIDAALDGGR